MSRRKLPRKQDRSGAVALLVAAALTGSVIGIGSVATTQEGKPMLAAIASHTAVATGLARKRAPQPGDRWGGCKDARAAGTAPIYRGEPGYRPQLDRDDDGVACEPYHGW